MKRTILINILLLLVFVSFTFGATIYVDDDGPADFNNIQAAIDDANDGDTVIVETGWYHEHISFCGKAITVRSRDPSSWDVVEDTIIYGGPKFIYLPPPIPPSAIIGSCVRFVNGEGSDSILDGVTLRGGGGTLSLSLEPDEPGWSLARVGGGIYCSDSSPTIRHCNIIYNGFIYEGKPFPPMQDEGTDYDGEAVAQDESTDYGGGIALLGDCQATICSCFITDNTAARYGGGIIIRSNSPAQARSTITNCTIVNNKSALDSSEYYKRYEVDCWNTQPIIYNTIIYGPDDRSLFIADPSRVIYSCVKEAYIFEGNYNEHAEPYNLTVAGDNISRLPDFVQPFFICLQEIMPGLCTEYQLPDYHLLIGSVCINAGDPIFVSDSKTDIDGQPRVMGGRVDIGADEVLPTIIVDKPTTGDIWISGSIHEIAWESYGYGTGAMNILFSKDGGGNWQTVESSIPDTGSYTWHLPDIVDSNQCLVWVAPGIPDPNVVCIESGLFTIHPDNPGPAVESKWKTLGGDFKRGGLSGNYGPELGCIKWKFETEAAVSTSVTIGINDSVHIACEDGKLYTLDTNGVLLWSYDTNSPLLSSPTVGPDGTVYVGSRDGKLFAIDVNGELRWTHRTESFIYSSPAVAPDGKIYACSQDGIVYALAHDGSELWSFETNGPAQLRGSIFASPAIGDDGAVYIAGLYEPNLYALDPNDGSVKWVCNFQFPIYPDWPEFGTTMGGLPFASPVIAEDGTIYQTLLYDANLYAIGPNDGTIIWSVNLAGGCEWFKECLEHETLEDCLEMAEMYNECVGWWFEPNYLEKYSDAGGWSEPALGPDGTIYVSFDDPYLRAVDPNGSIKWVTRLGMVGGFTLTVGDNGLIYAASDDGCLCVVNPDGEEIARFYSDRGLNFPVITADNTIIVADGQDNTMLIGDANNVVWAIEGGDCNGQMLVLHRPQDLDGSRTVNFIDFAVLATDWLECTDIYTVQSLCDYEGDEIYLAGDIDRDLYVDVADLADLADIWLSGE